MEAIVTGLNMLGGLGLFLYGLKIMSEGLQKAAGSRLRSILNTATGNRYKATLAGFVVTCAVQSSSATTVMVVSFCSAGLLSLYQALGIIFGANIGTTTTGWLVSLLGFKMNISQFALPLIGIGFFSQFVPRRWRWPHRIGEVFVGFGLLFYGLHLIKSFVPNSADSPEITAWMMRIQSGTINARLIAVLVGAVLTVIFQSSSATMAVTLAAAAAGLIDFPTSAALVLGENIGTTVTANLASIGAPITARRAARGHFFFNTFGLIWMFILFKPFISIIDAIVPGDPYETSQASLLLTVPTHIAAFHTVFNVTNTLIMLPLIRHLERFITWLIPDRKTGEEPVLRYLSTPLSQTPELAITAAKKEVDHMADVVLSMLHKICQVVKTPNEEITENLESILKDEVETDILENGINQFLVDLAHAHLSTASNKEVHSLMSMINDLERMGDHGQKISNLLSRYRQDDLKFSPESIQELIEITAKTEEIVGGMKNAILTDNGDPMPLARQREAELNQLRDRFRQSHFYRITKGKSSASAGILFVDMLTSFEKMGDHAFNVVEATVGIK